jgi:DNA gyrase/topoisomerase IV subunit A
MSYAKSPLEIINLLDNQLHIEHLEGFRHDTFSTEYVQNITRWDDIQHKDFLVLISTLGYAKKFISERILPKLSMPVPYKFTGMRGYPAFLLGINADEDYISVTHSGRVARVRMKDMPLLETRPITVPLKGNIISALSAKSQDTLLIVTRSGYAKRVTVGSIAYTQLNTNGDKLIQRSHPVYVGRIDPTARYTALTNQRVIDIDLSQVPTCDTDKTDYKLAHLKKEEAIITIFAHPFASS